MYPCNLKDDFAVSEVSDIVSNISSDDIEAMPASCAAKRTFVDVEPGPLEVLINPKRVNFKQSLDIVCSDSAKITDDTSSISMKLKPEVTSFNSPLSLIKDIATTSSIKNIGQSVQLTKNKLRLKAYRRSSLFSVDFNANIYSDAIKKIDIDNDRLFSSSILKEDAVIEEYRNFPRFSSDFSATYSNVRKYILESVFPCINDIIYTADVMITSGMSVSDMQSSSISNNHFFEKLHENCERILEDIRIIPDDYFSNMFQSYVYFNLEGCSNVVRKRGKCFSKKNNVSKKIKSLVIDTISDLPLKIISAIKNLDKSEIINSLFTNFHGVFIPNSLIRNLLSFSNSNKNKIPSGISGDNLCFFNNLLKNVENLVRTSCVFHEGEIFLPDECLVEEMSKYILSDMYGFSANFREKLGVSSVVTKAKNNVSDQVNHVIGKQYATGEKLGKSVVLEELKSRPYRRVNLYSAEVTKSIYERAIRKIEIDSGGLFKDSIFDEMSSIVVGKGLAKSSIDLSSTYSNVRKYVLNSISSYINDIIIAADVSVTPGMFISDVQRSCLSNSIFFERLYEKCEKMVKDLRVVSENEFLGMLRGYVRFGSGSYLNMVRIKYKLCSKMKELVIETIYNLPRSIISNIENFDQGEIVNGVFSSVHGVFVSKSLLRDIKHFFSFSYNKNKFPSDNFNDSLELLSGSLARLVSMVKASSIFRDGKVIVPDESTVKLMSRWLLADIYGISSKLCKNIELPAENMTRLSRSINDSSFRNFDCKEGTVGHTSVNTEFQLQLGRFGLIPKINSRGDFTSITSLNIYRLAIYMIDIDKDEFENSFVTRMKRMTLMKKYTINEENKITFDLSSIYSRVKNYILGVFLPFLKEIKEETGVEIKLRHGVTLAELEYAYISNENFFTKLRKFCADEIKRVESINDGTLAGMIRHYLPLKINGELKRIHMRRVRRLLFAEDIAQLLVSTISSIPEKIVDSIMLLPRYKLVGEYFSRFSDMYVDNKSLMKVRLILDSTRNKITKDTALLELMDKVSSDMIDKFGDGKGIINLSNQICKVINSYIVYEKLNAFCYIRKLARNEIPAVKDSLSGSVMVMCNAKVEIADQKIECKILDKFELCLIETSISLYKSLCFKYYKSKISCRV